MVMGRIAPLRAISWSSKDRCRSEHEDACSFRCKSDKEDHVDHDENNALPAFEFVLRTHHQERHAGADKGRWNDDVSGESVTGGREGKGMDKGR